MAADPAAVSAEDPAEDLAADPVAVALAARVGALAEVGTHHPLPAVILAAGITDPGGIMAAVAAAAAAEWSLRRS